MNSLTELILVVSGFVAGVIDSIAGGGGLITLPVLSEVLEPGAHAIGTNKIVGATGALIAFIVYLRKQKLNWKNGATFIIAVGAGSLIGSICNPLVPKIYFRYLLIAACPFLLWVLWNKQLFIRPIVGLTASGGSHSVPAVQSGLPGHFVIQEVKDHLPRKLLHLVVAGVLVGFYDGFFGPAGGTFMLLGLLWGVRLPLFEALLLSKLANTVSASVALVSYGVQGYVHPKHGIIMAVGMTTGGYLGAKLASKQAEKIVRPVLALVVCILMALQILEVMNRS